MQLKEASAGYTLEPGEGLGTAKPKDKQEVFISQIINRLNELFITDHLTEKDLVNYAYTIRDKISENELVMKQIANNSSTYSPPPLKKGDQGGFYLTNLP